jgi:hypothetical protein
VLLAALWVLSAFGGWAESAFCSDRGLGESCRTHVDAVVRTSAVPASIALTLAAVALLAPLRPYPKAQLRTVRMRLLALSAALWVLALVMLFIGGEVAAG